MKKTVALAILLLATLAPVAFGQAMLNVRQYAEYFGFRNGVIVSDDDYILGAPRAERTGEISSMEGRERAVDTPLEFALFSYYAASRINIRPPEADAVLPADNPRQADLLLGAAVFQELQVLRFLGDTVAVNRHEEVLRFITGRGNVTRAEVEAFYRNNIRALVSDMVDEQYAKLRAEIQNFNAPAAGLAEVKRAITNFMLNPSTASYAELLATYRRNAGNTAIVLARTMMEINYDIADALIDNRVLVSP